MKKRWIATILSLCMIMSIFPTAALAIEGNTARSSVELLLSNGPVVITETGYTQGTSTAETSHTGSYTIVQGEENPSSPNTITIQSGTIHMTIRGISIAAGNAPAIYVKAGAELRLTVEGENSLAGGTGFAAICVEPAYNNANNAYEYDADASAKLYIAGSGSLTATGGAGDQDSGTYGGGAGIGGNGEDQDGGDSVDFGLVEITEAFSGSIDAVGGAASEYKDGNNCFGGGAGIGSGGFNMGYINNYTSQYYWGEVFGSIVIRGGEITASSQGNGAGIGGGGGQGEDTAESHIDVTIAGGTIQATGGTLAAGIGGGGICDGGTITISGGQVAAQAGTSDGSMGAAGIGGGNDASVSRVSISGGAQVTATASGGAAGIGGGTNTSYSNVHYGDTNGTVTKKGIINISGEGTSVTAKGGTGEGYSGSYGGAGIGSGYPTANNNSRSVAFAIFITEGAAVRAFGGYHAQAIGYGYRPTDHTGYGITLTLDDTISLWAQNADYYQPALVAPTTYDASPIAYSSESVYLTHYVDADKEAENASEATVSGYLTQPNTTAAKTFDWEFDSNTNSVIITPEGNGTPTTVSEVTNLNGNWATLCTAEKASITIALADITIYVGGQGYESVVTDANGEPVKTESDGLPEPGFTAVLPEAVDQALKEAVGHTGEGPLDLSEYLSFSYDDGAGTKRSWTLERYDSKEGNTSIAGGKYIYRIVPAEGQDPVRLQFTDEAGNTTSSDQFTISLEDQYQVYDMTIYPGALDPEHLQAVLTLPDETEQTFALAVEPAELTIRGVVEEGDPTTTILTEDPVTKVEKVTAQVSPNTLFYINESKLEVAEWSEVKLLTDQIIKEAQEPLLDRTLDDFPAITEDFQYQFRYLDLVDTSNGNVWVTADQDVTLYWPYPEGTDQDTPFFLVHYEGLDRNYDDSLEGKEYTTTLYAVPEETSAAGEEDAGDGTQEESAPKVLEKTEYGLKFTVDSFSPFALFWKPVEKYTLHYVSNGGTEYQDEQYPAGTDVSLEKVPVREGYTFTGWYADEGLTEKITNVIMDSDKTVYAGWEKNDPGTNPDPDPDPPTPPDKWYVLHYESNGGTEYQDEQYPAGTDVSLEKVPVREGYTFTGWYADEGLTEKITNVIMNSDKTVYAGWEKNDPGTNPDPDPDPPTPPDKWYVLHYESNGGTEYPDEYYRPGTVVPLTKVPVREGYIFTGWYADEELTQRITQVLMDSDKTVYAGWRKSTVPDGLNGDDHFAYVIGYPDDTVRPLGNISRAEVAAIFFRLLTEETRQANLSTENPFSDVHEDAWYNISVSTLVSLGILNGRSDTLFVPDSPITRAEFAAICARFDTGVNEAVPTFSDIAGHWAEKEIQRAASLGWILGYPDDTFRPDQPITRAEAMTMINRVLNRIPEDESDLLPDMNVWPDNRPEDWFYLAVQEATNTHEYVHKGEIYETWIEMLEDPDWVQYQ